ncbi:alpha-1-acid glycoprotein-like isoform X2 [Mauremys reevesii]|uniref:alpha-1-acid glycoprotein-like isoform X2 n=1 Tax=Mauremys reevesii TaxID=260615 RepID=UPI00193EC25D|nr:alpha-1-acid glycoprotein-like isoform X2 [Mauremys reevesii]
MALAFIAIILGLAHLLTAKPLDCEPLVPETIDNTTMTKLLGKWFYHAGASQHPRTIQELELIKNAYYFLYPSSHQDTFLVTEVMRLKDNCVVNNSSYISVIRDNSTMTLHARAQNLSTEQLEEFKTQVACLGLKEEETFYASDKDLCPMEEERDDKKHSVEVVEPPLG